MKYTVTLGRAQLRLETLIFANAIVILTNSCCLYSIVNENNPDNVSFMVSFLHEHMDVTKIPDEVSSNPFFLCVFGLGSIFFSLSLYHLIRNAGFN